jgi:hypothetical protein
MIINNLNEINIINLPVVIIGSGPAAISLALELEKKKISSLLIEAGGGKYNHISQQSYKGEIIGDNISNLTHSRLRQFGGTSGHWGGWSKPLESYNFETWDINIDDLAKYSNQTCDILGIKNEFKSAKLDSYFNQIEFQYSKVRFAKKYKNHIENSKNINLVLNTQVSHFEGDNNLTKNAVCFSNGKKYKIKSKYFILACGGIENSRIMLWTREKNDNLINPYLPIGKYWMCHPWLLGGIGIIKKNKFKKILKKRFLEYDGPIHIATSEKIRIEKKILGGSIYMNAEEDTKLHKEIIKDLLCISPELGKKIARKVFKKDLKCGNIFLQLEEEAIESNQIKLHEVIKDNLNIPITKLIYNQSESTLNNAKIMLEEFGNFCKKTNSGRVAAKEEIHELEGYESLGVHHHMGGTKMGNNSKNSVVDKNLKVHDVKNLYIAGSSNFVSGGYANPTYTIIQLSLRLGTEIGSKLI